MRAVEFTLIKGWKKTDDGVEIPEGGARISLILDKILCVIESPEQTKNVITGIMVMPEFNKEQSTIFWVVGSYEETMAKLAGEQREC